MFCQKHHLPLMDRPWDSLDTLAQSGVSIHRSGIAAKSIRVGTSTCQLCKVSILTGNAIIRWIKSTDVNAVGSSIPS